MWERANEWTHTHNKSSAMMVCCMDHTHALYTSAHKLYANKAAAITAAAAATAALTAATANVQRAHIAKCVHTSHVCLYLYNMGTSRPACYRSVFVSCEHAAAIRTDTPSHRDRTYIILHTDTDRHTHGSSIWLWRMIKMDAKQYG